ncbi:uncharacterized protein GGS25DRAFT_266309 [Hypoxylon fragiforme]|uniref:uncharacterized protein n=1 Tax=Hypoxylon fragiforme TaxID=63214 RepID=UPI0020C6D696|nr:uncharacterized protein GGS25DRAFT_266309 [Hypoxylon fragiforme]KAI2608237.1 hypothetical protein GGS25DRAFT_266309 [Hypoxylon fragiforme]
MADEDLLRRIHGLGDLDLAALLCLTSREHCIVTTDAPELDGLVEEVRLVASQTFNLPSVIVNCTRYTTLDDLAAAILLPPPTPKAHQSFSPGPKPNPRDPTASPLRRPGTESSSYFRPGHHSRNSSHGTTSAMTVPPQIANVIVAKNLNLAPKDVQIQCLELLRTRRILTRTSVQTAPKQFLFVAVLETNGAARLVSHLNDFFYISHWHDPEDGFAHQEDGEYDTGYSDSTGQDSPSLNSESSVVRRSITDSTAAAFTSTPRGPRTRGPDNLRLNTNVRDSISGVSFRSTSSIFPSLSESDIATLAQLALSVHQDIEVLRYQMNIVTFLRMHRAVAPGGSCASPHATKHFGHLAKCLAALHGLDYVTPSLVALAAKKIYPHRIRIVDPARERSMQWGSDLSAVEALLEGVAPEDVVEDVLAEVGAPL